MENKNISCIYCNSKNIIKRGKQRTKHREKQVYYCNYCKRRFVFSEFKGKSYNSRIILESVSYYNLGNTIEECSRLINKRFKVKTSKSSIHNWLNEFKYICTYNRIRNKILASYEKDLLASKLFRHHGLTYNYKYHKAKLDLFCKSHIELINYLKGLENRFPHSIFNNEANLRCSQIKVNASVFKKNKNNYACKLAELVLKAARNSKERHSLIENFMLINDSATIAIEVPVWFWEKKLAINSKDNINDIKNNGAGSGTGICGHIDILQYRYGNLHILDFKPNASKENFQGVISQLYLYALGISFRTNIPLDKIRCAWFDENDYFEFEPKRVRVKW